MFQSFAHFHNTITKSRYIFNFIREKDQTEINWRKKKYMTMNYHIIFCYDIKLQIFKLGFPPKVDHVMSILAKLSCEWKFKLEVAYIRKKCIFTATFKDQTKAHLIRIGDLNFITVISWWQIEQLFPTVWNYQAFNHFVFSCKWETTLESQLYSTLHR